jgi:hypothetical protein
MSEPEPKKFTDSWLMQWANQMSEPSSPNLQSAHARTIILDLLETRKERDEAIAGMNANAEVIASAAKMCREARHVADLALAVLKTFKGDPKWDGISHFVNVIEGRYTWAKTGDLDYQPEVADS